MSNRIDIVFASGSEGATLAASSLGTMIDSGLVKYGPHTLNTEDSEDLTGWPSGAVTKIISPLVPPEPYSTSTRLTGTAVGESANMLNLTLVKGVTYTVHMAVAEDGGGLPRIDADGNFIRLRWTGGVPTIDFTSGAGFVSGSDSLTPLGDGYYLLEWQFIAAATGSTADVFIFPDRGAPGTRPTSVTGIHVYASPMVDQIVNGSSQAYVRSTGSPVFLPRFPADDGSTLWSAGTIKSYLHEPSETNLITHSNDITDASYVKTNYTPGAALSDVGALQGRALLENAVNSGHFVTVISAKDEVSENYVCTFLLRKRGRQFLNLRVSNSSSGGVLVRVDLDALVIDLPLIAAGWTLEGTKIDLLAGGIVRVAISVTTDSSATIGCVILGLDDDGTTVQYLGDATKGFDYCGGMLEKNGNLFSSHIFTAGSAGTRTADEGDIDDLEAVNPSRGTMVLDARIFGGTETDNRLVVFSADVLNFMRLMQNPAPNLAIEAEGGGAGTTTSVALNNYVDGDLVSLGGTYDFGTGTTAVADGGAVDIDAGLGTPFSGIVSNGKLFSDPDTAGKSSSGLIQRFRYFDTVLDPATLRLLTAGFGAIPDSPLQSRRHAVFRDQAGTVGSYNEDFREFIFSVAPSLSGSMQVMNELIYEWLTLSGFAQDTLPGKLQAFAADNGAFNWSSLGAFTPVPVGGVFGLEFSPEFS